jgi:hypothetical protein
MEMQVLRPGLVALAATARVEHPAAFLLSRSDRLIRLSFPLPAGLYSVYIGVEDKHGSTFFAVGGSGSYVRPDLAACTSLSIRGIGQPPPPPCPA